MSPYVQYVGMAICGELSLTKTHQKAFFHIQSKSVRNSDHERKSNAENREGSFNIVLKHCI